MYYVKVSVHVGTSGRIYWTALKLLILHHFRVDSIKIVERSDGKYIGAEVSYKDAPSFRFFIYLSADGSAIHTVGTGSSRDNSEYIYRLVRAILDGILPSARLEEHYWIRRLLELSPAD